MESIKKALSFYPLYLFLYPIFFVLHGFLQNYYFVSIGSALILTGIYSIAALIIATLFYPIFRRLIPASVVACFILSFHFFFGILFDFLKQSFPNTIITRYSSIISFFFILLVVLVFLLKRTKNLFQVAAYLNTLFAVLILLDAVLLTKEVLQKQKIANLSHSYRACFGSPKPDIYIILLDEYAGDEELKNQFHYNNQQFFDSLAYRGFRTIQDSHSNYNYTPYSTASTLNMEYLDSTQAGNLRETGNRYAETKINNSEFISFLIANGYKFFNYSIFKVHGQAAPTAGSFVPANTKLITANTFFSRFEKDVLLNIAEKLRMRKYISELLNSANADNKKLIGLTMNIAGENVKQPKLVYTHLLMPHHPYYYDEKGNFHEFESVNQLNLADKGAYLSYLKYTNKVVLRLIDHVLTASKSSPLVVLLSDHGFRHIPVEKKDKVFSNLVSFRVPQDGNKRYPDTLCNVNLFRVLLNNEFNQRLPLLKDERHYIAF